MSRSYSKYINSWGRNWKRVSEKEDKKEWHRKFRRKMDYLCNKGEEDPFVHIHDVSNRYMMRKDDSPKKIKRIHLKRVVQEELEKDMQYGWFNEKTKEKVYSLKYRSSK